MNNTEQVANAPHAPHLQKANVTVVPGDDCSRAYGKAVVDDGGLCALGVASDAGAFADACQVRQR